FENMVYLKIKHNDPCYIYEDGNEIDFFFKDTLMEIKFGKELKGKQLRLFEKIPAKKKIIVSEWQEYMKLK
ncbi:MAG: ATP-binding protein, partial [Deltaproteobacteria bacterium]|nr:ATP-binding protein [Deltaproteobacteria bacterium]